MIALLTEQPSFVKNFSRPASPDANADIDIRIVASVNDPFGYDILTCSKPLVHQPSLPGMPRNEGFKMKEYVLKVAALAFKKIRNIEMPSTATLEELNGMGVRNTKGSRKYSVPAQAKTKNLP